MIKGKNLLGKSCRVVSATLVPMMLSIAYNSSYAGAFALNEQSASGLGNAFAGRAAIAEDVSTSFYNPAGLTLFHTHQVVASLNSPFPAIDAKMRSATRAFAGVPLLTGNPKDDAGAYVPIPAAHIGGPLHKNWAYGLSVTAPFGLKTEYDKTSRFRYFGTLSELKVIDFNPNLAYRVDSKWSVGAGVSVQYAKAILARQIDNFPIWPCGPDGSAKNTADGYGFGYNFGVLFKPTTATRMGFAFRSKVKQDVEGHLKVKNINPVFALPATGLVNQKAKATVTLPEVASVSAFQSLTPEWDIMGDVTFTNWHRFKKLVIKYPDTNLAQSIVEEKFKNTFKVSLGANYRYNHALLWKFGTAYDASPVENKHRNLRIPDADRYWLSTGFKYMFSKRANLDVGYSHLFFKSASINEQPIVSNPLFSHAMANARVKSGINLVGVQLTYNLS